MEEQIENQKRCLHCNAVLKGRSDKKFCNLLHKNAFNNHENRNKTLVYKGVDKKLHHNHKTLAKFYPLSKGEKHIDQRPLTLDGFDSKFFIQSLTENNTREKYFMIYDYAFSFNSLLQIKIIYKNGGFHNI